MVVGSSCLLLYYFTTLLSKNRLKNKTIVYHIFLMIGELCSDWVFMIYDFMLWRSSVLLLGRFAIECVFFLISCDIAGGVDHVFPACDAFTLTVIIKPLLVRARVFRRVSQPLQSWVSYSFLQKNTKLCKILCIYMYMALKYFYQ